VLLVLLLLVFQPVQPGAEEISPIPGLAAGTRNLDIEIGQRDGNIVRSLRFERIIGGDFQAHPAGRTINSEGAASADRQIKAKRIFPASTEAGGDTNLGCTVLPKEP